MEKTGRKFIFLIGFISIFIQSTNAGSVVSTIGLQTNVSAPVIRSVFDEDPLYPYLEGLIEEHKQELARTDSNHFSYKSIQQDLENHQKHLDRAKNLNELLKKYTNSKRSGSAIEKDRLDRELGLYVAKLDERLTGKLVPKDPRISKMEGTPDPVIWKRRITLGVIALMLLCPPLFLWRRQVQRGR
jgi:hypothetical protein